MENNDIINLIYKIRFETSIGKLFGLNFIKNNAKIELIVNGIKSELVKEHALKEGEINVQIIIKNKLMI